MRPPHMACARPHMLLIINVFYFLLRPLRSRGDRVCGTALLQPVHGADPAVAVEQ